MKKYIFELFGTFILVLFGCGTVSLLGESCTPVVAGLSFALPFLVSYYALNKVCPCYFNPIFSFVSFLNKKISLKNFIIFTLLEFLGAFLACLQLFLLVFLTKDPGAYTYNLLAINGFGELSRSNFPLWATLFLELFLAFILATVFLILKHQKNPSIYFGLIVAAVYFIVVCISFNLTGGSVNPARSFGPIYLVIFVGVTEPSIQFWVFLVGSAAGAFLSYVLYHFLLIQHLGWVDKIGDFLKKIF